SLRRAATAASSRLGLPHNPQEAAVAARRKDLLRERLRAAGVKTPRYRVTTIVPDPEPGAYDQTYPCVLKPTFLSASRGVIRANDADEFVLAYRRIATLLRKPDVAGRGGEAARQILVEEFIPGQEVALEGLLLDGRLKVLAIFDKPDALDGPFFEETIYVTPSRHPPGAQRAVAETT